MGLKKSRRDYRREILPGRQDLQDHSFVCWLEATHVVTWCGEQEKRSFDIRNLSGLM